jgi:GWxTD domain-containing protein
VVASFSTMAGPADSTLVLMGLSMPNSALRFQRDARGFYAEYDVDVLFMDSDSVAVHRFSRRQTVRIQSFSETSRTDESVVFQHPLAVAPGRYIVHLQAADANSSRGFRMTDTLTAPSYGPAAARLSSPVLAYRADGRSGRADAPSLILNPRHTVPFGGEQPILYMEAYDGTTSLTAEVISADGQQVWRAVFALTGDGDVRTGTVTIPSQDFPLGRFWVRVAGAGAVSDPRPLLLTISDQWMVANFEDVLQILRYIASTAELDSLRTGTPADRREQWERFWERRNSLPQTGVNEYRDQFFQRVRFATEAFREPGGRAGWQTDRGEVYIVLGPPDHVVERYLGRTDVTGQPNALEWVYSHAAGGRLNLLFHDRTGFGRFELVPASASAFRSAAERLRPRPDRN